jgi:hypothetical protein
MNLFDEEEVQKDIEVRQKDRLVLVGVDNEFYDKDIEKEYHYERLPNGSFPKEAFYKAFELCGGNISRAARLMGCTRNAFYKRINSDPEFKEILDDIKETKVDIAEDKLYKLIEIGQPQAVTFFLSTIGKERGYTKATVLQGDKNRPVQININIGDEDYG